MTTWTEFSIHTTNEAVEPICHLLHEADAGGVVIEDSSDLLKQWGVLYGELYELSPDDYPEDGVRIKAYFQDDEQVTEKILKLKEAITSLQKLNINVGRNHIRLTSVQADDWEEGWKKYYKPVHVTERITIVPTWETYEKQDEEMIVHLDPGMAFGTGSHPSTTLAIHALEKTIQGGERVIDVGTGSGILSIVAAKLGVEHVLALDLDQVAVASATQNISLNEMDSVIAVKQNNLLDAVHDEVDIVVANILAHIIIDLTSDAARALKRDGLFITSGIIHDKKDEVKEALQLHGFIIEEILQEDHWVALIAKKK